MRSKQSKSTRTPGFSLVEVLIALTLFGFLVAGIMTFVTSGLEVTQKTESQLMVHKDENIQIRKIESALVYPVERIDSWITASASLSGAILQIDGTTMFIGSQSMTGICNDTPMQQFLVTHSAIGLSKNENTTYGNISIAPDGLSILSGSTRIIGSGVRGGAIWSALETEFGGVSSISGSGNILALADPNNEQIFFWNIATKNLAAITTRATGIEHPMSVTFSGDTLLIGGKNGLFRMRDSKENGGELKNNPTNGPPTTLTALERIVITLEGGASITSPTNIGSITLEQWQGGSWQSLKDPNDTLTPIGNGYLYTFSGAARTIDASNPLRINIINIAWVPTATWPYTANIVVYDTSNASLWSKRIPYFTRGDLDIQSLAGNTIEQISKATQVRNVVSETTFQSGAVSMDDYLTISWKRTQSVYPIRDFRLQETSQEIIINFEAYTNFDCRTGVQKSKQRTLIFRKK